MGWGVADCYAFSCFHDNVGLRNLPAIRHIESTDAVVDAIKLLSDRSRFEILKYISHKEAYGNEIAEHLNLTTATVSHHMGLLIAADLVKLEPRNSKMYYSLNKDTLRQYLEFYEEKLL